MWIFGYGSLMWKTGFEYEESRVGFIRGWSRRFYQGSTDHRGVPGAPGRVVTLVQQDGQDEQITWGVAFRIHEDKVAEVVAYLDHREKGGYSCCVADFFTSESDQEPQLQVSCYMALPANEEWLGPAPARDIASQICKSVGPSGPNTEYLLRLAECIRSLNLQDPHIFEIETHVLEILAATTTGLSVASRTPALPTRAD
mmetsp:Transcript_29792/g.68910  ORF Transcript_29792/g.68910 Transcript_29792/m.68910 type:complete len:199 (-) Transcript_29792:39-635(-)